MRLLWVKAGKLLPVDTGGKIRSYNILRHLARDHEVTLLSYYSGPKDSGYETAIKLEFPRAHTVHTATSGRNILAESLDYLRRLFLPAPFAISRFAQPEVKRLVASWMREQRFDILICDFLAPSLNFPDKLDVPALLFQHNVETTLWQRRARTESNPVKHLVYRIEAVKMARYERRALHKFHHIVAVSNLDQQQMLAMDPTCAISVVPTGVDTGKYVAAPPAKANPPRIIFTGSMDWEPNIDAVTYFCKEIFPRVRAELPTAVFQIVGRTPVPRVKQLASDAVQVTGTVPSIVQYLFDATVVIVPLRAGGGTRLKIFEAMAMGKAVVSTTIGAEGLDMQSGRDLILADNPTAFAAAIILLVRDPELRRRYERAAAELAAQQDWSVIAKRFADVLQTVKDNN